MQTKIIEAVQDGAFYGKFLLGRFDKEWRRDSIVHAEDDQRISVLRAEGWTGQHLLVLDLSSSGAGAIFLPRSRGDAYNDVVEQRLIGVV